MQITHQIELKKYELSYAASEETKVLRTNIQFSGGDKRVLLITSAIASEGKSTISLNLARSLAELGKKVLLIEADLRRPSLKYRITDGTVDKGLSHYLSDLCELSDIIYATESENVYAVFAGTIPPNPSELLANPRMADLLKLCRKEFDYIIVDAPPLGTVIDAAVVAPLCDGVILTIEADIVHYRLAQEVVEKINTTQCPILGVVLNKVDLKRKGYYGKYYGGYYKKYRYHYDDKSKK